MSALQFVVPGPAVGKARPKAMVMAGRAHIYTPKKSASYEGLVAQCAQAAMQGRPLFDGPVELALDIRCAVPQSWSGRQQRRALAGEVMPTTKPDVDNVLKAVADGLNGVAWRDDVQCVDVRVRKRYASVPGVLVTIESIARTEPVQQELPSMPSTKPGELSLADY